MTEQEMRFQIEEGLRMLEKDPIGTVALRDKVLDLVKTMLSQVDMGAMSVKEAYDNTRTIVGALIEQDRRLASDSLEDRRRAVTA